MPKESQGSTVFIEVVLDSSVRYVDFIRGQALDGDSSKTIRRYVAVTLLADQLNLDGEDFAQAARQAIEDKIISDGRVIVLSSPIETDSESSEIGLLVHHSSLRITGGKIVSGA